MFAVVLFVSHATVLKMNYKSGADDFLCLLLVLVSVSVLFSPCLCLDDYLGLGS